MKDPRHYRHYRYNRSGRLRFCYAFLLRVYYSRSLYGFNLYILLLHLSLIYAEKYVIVGVSVVLVVSPSVGLSVHIS